MDESVDLVRKFNEGTESSDLGDFALDNVADFVDVADVDPGIVFSLLETERDSLQFGIDFKNDNFNFLSGFENFVGVVDLAGPARRLVRRPCLLPTTMN